MTPHAVAGPPDSTDGIEPAVPATMADDVATLIRLDHEDLDRILLAMVEPAASPSECVTFLEALRIGFAAHAGAQASVLRRLLCDAAIPQALRMIISATFDEH